MKKITLIPVLVMFLAQVSVVYGLEVADYQEEFSLNMQRGEQYTFPLVLRNTDDDDLKDVEVTSTSDWVDFKEANKYTIPLIPSYERYILSVTITVPGDAEIGTYDIEIEADGEMVSSIEVNVVLSPYEIKTLEESAGLKTEIATMKEDLSTVIGEVSTAIDGVNTAIEGVNTNLGSTGQAIEEKLTTVGNQIEGFVVREKEIEGLKAENEDLKVTGAFASSSSFILGLIVVVIIAFFVLKNTSLFRREDRGYRYSPR